MSDLLQKECFGRGIFSKSRAKRFKKNGKCPYDIFVPGREKRSISVDQFNIITDREMTKVGDQAAAERERFFYGWATLRGSEIIQNERKIELTPLPGRPCHADIILPLKRQEVRRRVHAEELASFAKWKERVDG